MFGGDGGDYAGQPVPDLSKISLSELRERIDAITDDAETSRWAECLRGDQRAGARDLGDRVLRQLESVRLDRERVAALFELRAELLEGGCRFVAGVDEVGVGPLAGPVVAAAVVLPEKVDLPGLNDSKKLSRSDRERLNSSIREEATAVAVGEVSAVEIDRVNIYQASLEAMRRAAAALGERVEVDHLLVDARTIPGVEVPQTPLVHGDAIDGNCSQRI